MNHIKLIETLALMVCASVVSCRPICPDVPEDSIPADSIPADSIPADTVSSPAILYVGDYTEDPASVASSPFDMVCKGIRVGDTTDAVEGVEYLLLEYTDTTAAVDCHYLPACWRDVPAGEILADTVCQYTQRILTSIPTVRVRYVQISRDISHGLLWQSEEDQLILSKPMSANPTAWQHQALYIKAAIRAVRACCPEAKIVLQTSKLGSTESLHEQLPRLLSNWAELGIEYDVLSFCVAPAIRSSLADFESGLTSLFAPESRWYFDFELLAGKEFQFETFYPCSSDIPEDVFVRSASKAGYPYTPSGQRDYLHDWKAIINSNVAGYPLTLVYRHATSPAFFRLYDYSYLTGE